MLPREVGRADTVGVLQMSRSLLGGGERRGRTPQREQPTNAHVEAGRREEPRWCVVCRAQEAGGGEAEWGALSGVEATPGPGNQSPERSCASSCRCVGGRTGGLIRRCGGRDEAGGAAGPTVGAASSSIRPQVEALFSRRSEITPARIPPARQREGPEGCTCPVGPHGEEAGPSLPQQQGEEDLFPGSFPPLEQVGPKAPLPGSILASLVCRPPGILVPREPRMGRDVLSEARHWGPPSRESSQTASRLRVSMHHLGGEGFCQSRTRGNELTEDPTHVEQGGELPRLLDIKVICWNDSRGFKVITKKDLLYSTGNSAQCHVAAWIGGVWGRVDICICRAESPGCSPATITALLIGYPPNQN